MIAQLPRGFFEQVRCIGMLQRRRGVLVHPRRFEDVSAVDQLAAQVAGLAADAHHLFGVPVVRLEFVVGDAPVLDREIGGEARGAMLFGEMRAQGEEAGQETEAHAGPMLAGAADAGAGMEGAVLAHGNRGFAGRVAVRDGLFSDVLHHAQADVVVELIHVHGVFGEAARVAAFKSQDVGRGAGDELLGHGESGPAAADDHDIYGFEVGHIGYLGRRGARCAAGRRFER